MMQCKTNPDSAGCLSRVEKNCFSALKKCANVADDILPPKKSYYNSVSFTADCNNPADIAALNTHRNDFHGNVKDCAKKYWGSPVPTAHCIMSKTANTLPCATCFGTDSHCAVKNCMMQCMSNPDSPGCLSSCVEKNCFSALMKCANVADDILPPKKSYYNSVSFTADCNNPADIAALNTHRNDFHGNVKDCAKKYWGSPVPTAHCIMSKTANTLPCATCFGTDSHCAVKNCMMQCMSNPDSPGCLSSCVEKNCFSALMKCANVADDILPP
jgi:homoaconitase/3-isopropylmalate dehydratase large subunit